MEVDESLVVLAAKTLIEAALDPVPVGHGVMPSRPETDVSNEGFRDTGAVVVGRMPQGDRGMTPGYLASPQQFRPVRILITGYGSQMDQAELLAVRARQVLTGRDAAGSHLYAIVIPGHRVEMREHVGDGNQDRVQQDYFSQTLVDLTVQATA